MRLLVWISLAVMASVSAGSPMFGGERYFTWRDGTVQSVLVDRDGFPGLIDAVGFRQAVTQAVSRWDRQDSLGLRFNSAQSHGADIDSLRSFEERVVGVDGIHLVIDNHGEIFDSPWVGEYQRRTASAVCIMGPRPASEQHFQWMAIVIRPDSPATLGALEELLAHELGHCIGLDHSQLAYSPEPPRLQTRPLMSPEQFGTRPMASDLAWQAWLYHRNTDRFAKKYSVLRALTADKAGARRFSGVHVVAIRDDGAAFGGFSLEPVTPTPPGWNVELPLEYGTYDLWIQQADPNFFLTINQSGPLATRAVDQPGIVAARVHTSLVIDKPVVDIGRIEIQPTPRAR